MGPVVIQQAESVEKQPTGVWLVPAVRGKLQKLGRQMFTDSWTLTDGWPLTWCVMALKIYPLGTVNIQTEFNFNPANCC